MTKLLTAIWAGLVALLTGIPQISDSVVSPNLKSIISLVVAVLIAIISSYVGPTAINALARGMQRGLKLGQERRKRNASTRTKNSHG